MTPEAPDAEIIPEFNPVLTLLEFGRRSRHAANANELGFLLVNETRNLLPYRQAGIWTREEGLRTLSGVLKVEANAPYAQWLAEVMEHCADAHEAPRILDSQHLPEELALSWAEWLPAFACWLPLHGKNNVSSGGVIFARELPFSDVEVALLTEWVDIWLVAWKLEHARGSWTWRRLTKNLRALLRSDREIGLPWWKTRTARIGACMALALLLPVRLTVLAPAELVPAHPSIVRAPLDGVIKSVSVQPNQKVRSGQLLFTFDEALLRSRLDLARQEALTAQAELRQASQAALLEPGARFQLLSLMGKVEERQEQAAYIEQQLQRTQVVAPVDGIVLMDEPSEWIGRSVTIGHTVLRIAKLDDVEVEAWLGVADAIPLPENASVTLHLNASPLSPVNATVRYMAFEPVERAPGDYSYRLRALPEERVTHRVGLKGTARISGRRVPLGYWILRRPIAAIRARLGW